MVCHSVFMNQPDMGRTGCVRSDGACRDGQGIRHDETGSYRTDEPNDSRHGGDISYLTLRSRPQRDVGWMRPAEMWDFISGGRGLGLEPSGPATAVRQNNVDLSRGNGPPESAEELVQTVLRPTNEF